MNENPYKQKRREAFEKLKSFNVISEYQIINRTFVRKIINNRKILEAWTDFVKQSGLEQGYDTAMYEKRMK